MITPAGSIWPLETYFTEFRVHTVPFALRVSGTDAAGNSFEINSKWSWRCLPPTLACTLIPTIAEPLGGRRLRDSSDDKLRRARHFCRIATSADGAMLIARQHPAVRGDKTKRRHANPAGTTGGPFRLRFTVTLTATAASCSDWRSANEAVLESQSPRNQWTCFRMDTRERKTGLIHLDPKQLDKHWARQGVTGDSVNIAKRSGTRYRVLWAISPRGTARCTACAAPVPHSIDLQW